MLDRLTFDRIVLIGIILTGVGLGLFASRTGWRRVKIFGGIALLIGLIGFGSRFWSQMAIAEHNGTQPLRGNTIPMKPDLDKTILGYHFMTPREGGEVMFANGAVWWMSKEEFALALKAISPDDAWKSPVREPDPPTKGDPNVADAIRKVRQAEARMKLSNDLKEIVGAYYRFTSTNRRPPLNPTELGNGLSARINDGLNDGTYVVLFGWSLRPEGAGDELFAKVYRLGMWNWISTLVCVFALAMVGYTVVVAVRTMLSGRQVVGSPVDAK